MERKSTSVENYALKILSDAGCDCYTYGGEWSKHVLDDLKEAFPDGMEYPYVDVANAILAISKVKPITRAPYRVVVDTDSFCDGFDCESLERAKGEAEDTLLEWMWQERMEWKDAFHPTEEELDNYNYMIFNSAAYVEKYSPYTDEYEEEWWPDEEEIGWKELTMEDIEKQSEEANAD